MSTPRPPSLDDAFKALADPGRRRLLDRLHERNGQNLSDLCEGMDMARQSVSKHLEILVAAGLVVTTRRGRERLHFLNTAPINDIADRWIGKYDRERARALADLKHALESTSMTTRSFVYTTYIKATPEQVWQGLTSPAFTRRYWDLEFTTDWSVGSPMTWTLQGVTIESPEQVVVEADPFRRLAYTWHTFTPELMANFGIDAETTAKLTGETRSTATFELEDRDGMVKLTVVHDGFDPDSVAVTMVSDGWPQVLSALKTLLETGEPLGAGH